MDENRFQQILINHQLKKDKGYLNMMALLVDVQEQYLHQIAFSEFKGSLQKQYKRLLSDMKDFVKNCDDNLKNESQEEYGFLADDIKELLDKRFGL